LTSPRGGDRVKKQQKSISKKKKSVAARKSTTTKNAASKRETAKKTKNADMRKTKDKLIDELTKLRRRVVKLENSAVKHRQVEEALAERTEQLKTFINTIPDAVYLYDLKGRNLIVNKVYEDFVGKSKEEILGKTAEQLLPPVLARQCVLSNKKVFETKKLVQSEETDGDITFETIKAPLTNSDGNVIGLVGVSRDITENKRKEHLLKKSNESLELTIRKRTAELVSANDVLEKEIAERKKIEEKLYHSQNYLKSIIEAEADCVMIIGPDCQVLEMNPAGLAMIGEDSPDKVIGSKLCPIIDADYNEAFFAFVKEVCDGKKSTFTYTITDSIGKRKWLESHGVPFRDAINNRTLMLAVTRDITERKVADAELRERERQLAESQRIAHIGSWEHNLTTNKVVWSDELFRVLGLDPEKDPADFDMFFSMIHPDDKPILKKAIGETLETGKHFSVEYRFILRDGRTRILHAQAELITDETGTQNILSGTGQDITESKEAESKLIESEERFRGAFENAAVGASIVDLKGGFIKANRVLCDLLGYSEEELLSKTFSDVTHQDDVQVGLDVLHKMLSGKLEYTSFEKRYVRKDGDVIYVIISPALIRDGNGKPQRFITLCQDITEQKMTEDALKESQKLIETIIESTPT
jgi:PAS domain S-box-containing protein